MKGLIGAVVTNCKNYFILLTAGNFWRVHPYVLLQSCRAEKLLGSSTVWRNETFIRLARRNFGRSSAVVGAIIVACSSTFDQPGWSKQPEDAKAASGAKQEADGDLNIQSLGDALGQSLSFFDATMEDAMNSHFLERFSFRQFGFSVTDDGYTEILMRLPRLKPGRPFITLTFALDQDGKIIRSRLNIQRRYIEDKIHGAFARDYAKSFVQAAVSYKSQESVDTIANEIFYRQDLAMIKNIQSKLPSPSASDQKTSPPEELKEGDVIISGAVGKTADVPDLPKHVSEMYRCFTGKEKVSKMKLNDAVLKFSNENLNGEATLVITVEAIGFEHQDDLKNVDFENLPMHVPAI